ncbi:MAG TPA: Holliday junction branch migration protein RuvA [Candidatus Dojkabacteria bacterium]|nr:Holliday junction branch migration protein RuvA [Candidatus Dojkabacteria bacterium]
MISYIQGKIIAVEAQDRYQLVDVLLNNGIGYQVVVSRLLNYIVGNEVVFHTLLVVREDSQTLYGFRSIEERKVFEMLISVSGIGPKIAMAIFSIYSVGEIYEILTSGDYKALGKVSGLGQKGAQKIVIELSNKVDALGIMVEGIAGDEKKHTLDELSQALKSLGFSGDSLKAYSDAAKDILKEQDYSVEELIKLVLKSS